MPAHKRKNQKSGQWQCRNKSKQVIHGVWFNRFLFHISRSSPWYVFWLISQLSELLYIQGLVLSVSLHHKGQSYRDLSGSHRKNEQKHNLSICLPPPCSCSNKSKSGSIQ